MSGGSPRSKRYRANSRVESSLRCPSPHRSALAARRHRTRFAAGSKPSHNAQASTLQTNAQPQLLVKQTRVSINLLVYRPHIVLGNVTNLVKVGHRNAVGECAALSCTTQSASEPSPTGRSPVDPCCVCVQPLIGRPRQQTGLRDLSINKYTNARQARQFDAERSSDGGNTRRTPELNLCQFTKAATRRSVRASSSRS